MGEILTCSNSLITSELAGHPKAGVFSILGSTECVKVISEVCQNWSIFTASLAVLHYGFCAKANLSSLGLLWRHWTTFFLIVWQRVDARVKCFDFLDPKSGESQSLLTCFCSSNDKLILLLNEIRSFKKELTIAGKHTMFWTTNKNVFVRYNGTWILKKKEKNLLLK